MTPPEQPLPPPVLNTDSSMLNPPQDCQAYSTQEPDTDMIPTTDPSTGNANLEVLPTEEQTQEAPQIFQAFECSFDSSKDRHGIVESFSTGSTFNSTVGDSRLWMGIKDDNRKMTNGKENNYFKALQWSPDGSCLLSSSNDNCLRIFALPDSTTCTPGVAQLQTGLLIREGEVIYDMCWYPGMTSTDPATCCVLSSSRDHPIHLWDAFTGELRCSYTIVDHCEVNVAPNALCFNLNGSKIYCGSNNMIEIFDTTRPGRDSYKRPTVPTRKSKKGQKGVISCLAFNPDHSDLYAAGSYLKTIGLYDARADELLLLLRDNKSRQQRKHHGTGGKTAPDKRDDAVESARMKDLCPMGGLTQLKFSPDGQHLYSASRQDPYIRCWDIRNTAQVLYRLERPGETSNQRISFDISSDGRWLSTGDMNGDLSIFDLVSPSEGESDRLALRIHSHQDVISAASFHPTGSALATCSGQRKYDLSILTSSSESSESDDSDCEDKESRKDTPVKSLSEGMGAVDEHKIDNSIRLWNLPGEHLWYVNGQRWSEDAAVATTEGGVDPSEGHAEGMQEDAKGLISETMEEVVSSLV